MPQAELASNVRICHASYNATPSRESRVPPAFRERFDQRARLRIVFKREEASEASQPVEHDLARTHSAREDCAPPRSINCKASVDLGAVFESQVPGIFQTLDRFCSRCQPHLDSATCGLV